MAIEEGVSTDELLKSDKDDGESMEVSAQEVDDQREHLNVIFIGHVGTSQCLGFLLFTSFVEMLANPRSVATFCK